MVISKYIKHAKVILFKAVDLHRIVKSPTTEGTVRYLRLILRSRTAPKNPLSRLVLALDVEPWRVLFLSLPRSLRHILIVPAGSVARSSGELAELRDGLDGGASREEPAREPGPESA